MDALDLLIYLDASLSQNLSALVIDGYFEAQTSKFIEDRTLTARTGNEGSNQRYGEDKCIRDERDGYKGKNYTETDTVTSLNKNNEGIEGRRFVRREEQVTRIYTSFEIHNQMLQGLNEANAIKTIDSLTTLDNVSPGDYVKVNGEICSESMVAYIDGLSTLLDSIGVDTLNSFFKGMNITSNNLINYNMMYKQVKYLKALLTNNNSQDMLMKCGNTDVILTVNNANFMNNYNVYDAGECPCTVVGKVVRKCSDSDCIHLLRKSGLPSFYENLLTTYEPLLKNLSDNGIYVPEAPRFKIEGESLLLVPISLCV